VVLCAFAIERVYGGSSAFCPVAMHVPDRDKDPAASSLYYSSLQGKTATTEVSVVRWAPSPSQRAARLWTIPFASFASLADLYQLHPDLSNSKITIIRITH
jgi:hypothetical protein